LLAAGDKSNIGKLRESAFLDKRDEFLKKELHLANQEIEFLRKDNERLKNQANIRMIYSDKQSTKLYIFK